MLAATLLHKTFSSNGQGLSADKSSTQVRSSLSGCLPSLPPRYVCSGKDILVFSYRHAEKWTRTIALIKANSVNGKLWDNPAKFCTFDIVFLIIDSSNFCFRRAIGGIFFPHIKDVKSPMIYHSICYKFSKDFFFFAIVPILFWQIQLQITFLSCGNSRVY